jgi:outer membrane immunogenic protein
LPNWKTAFLAGVGIAALSIAGPAVAADISTTKPIYTKAPVYKAPAPFSWAGFYFGVQGGGDWGHSQHQGSAGNITNNFGLSGGSIGVEYGTNWQFGPWVLGMESDYSYLSLKGSAPELLNPGFAATTNQNYLGMSRVRVGYAQDRWLVYATGGLSDGYVTAMTSGPAGSISDTEFRWGWNAGGGVEWAFAPQWSAKVEYIHVDLGHKAYLNPEPAPFLDRANGVSLTDDMVRVGLNYHYDLPGLLLQTVSGH